MNLPKMILTVAISGGMTPSRSQYIPLSVEEQAEECYRVWKAGAAAVHLHARDPKDARPSSSIDHWGELVTKVKKRCPDLIISMTSSGAPGVTVEHRLAMIKHFKPELTTVTPESINYSVFHFVPKIKEWRYDWEKPLLMKSFTSVSQVYPFAEIIQFCKEFREVGTKPEMEIFSTSGLHNARWLYQEGVLERPVNVNFVLGILGGTGAYHSEVLHLQTEALRMFGEGNFNWATDGVGYPAGFTLGAMAIGMGGNVRVGMEDDVYIRPGVLAKSNLEMVEDIKTMASICGRELATPDEARQILGLKGIDKVNF